MISFIEIIYLIITIVVIGYIFTGIIRKPRKDAILYQKKFDWEDFKYACLIASPGIVFHELAHKFVAMAFGLKAVYQVWPTGLFIGTLLKFFGSGFILLAPGYVAISGGNNFTMMVTAFAGPFVNLILWVGTGYYLKKAKHVSRNKAIGLTILKEINKWLFLFNMIPIPPLDGSKVLFGLMGLF